MKKKIKYYLAAIRWLWQNRSWANTRQKWKAFDKAMREWETADNGWTWHTFQPPTEAELYGKRMGGHSR